MYITVDEGQQYDTIYMPLCGHFSDDVLPIYAAKRKINFEIYSYFLFM